MFEIFRRFRRRSRSRSRSRRSEADLTGEMGRDTGKNDWAVISPLSPLNKRDNRAKQQAGIPRHERYHNLFCQAPISVLSHS